MTDLKSSSAHDAIAVLDDSRNGICFSLNQPSLVWASCINDWLSIMMPQKEQLVVRDHRGFTFFIQFYEFSFV